MEYIRQNKYKVENIELCDDMSDEYIDTTYDEAEENIDLNDESTNNFIGIWSLNATRSIIDEGISSTDDEDEDEYDD